MNANNRHALVTGAGSGIGRQVALALSNDGYQVFLAGRRSSGLDATAAAGQSNAGHLIPVPTDVTKPESVGHLFDTIRTTSGRLDVLFNNAGISAPAIAFDELTLEQWNSIVGINLTGCFLCAQHAFRLMKSQTPRGGRIINNGSISAHAPRPDSAPYTATKHAITGLTKSLSLDGRPFDVACSQIDIGNAATEMTAPMIEGVRQANGAKLPEPRMDVKHVAEAVLYIANLPLSANVQFMTLMATKMPYIGRG
jgi:NAD(P)-dependent dehydrogenase (short-subunit alcohol dehydrogenase family)